MKSTYIIGEIGQNHNGSVDLAKKLIEVASLPIIEQAFGAELAPMNAVKLQKRDLREELTASEMNRPYTTAHSFGATYGEHRRHLELRDEEHHELYVYAKERGLEFVETICAPGGLSLINHFVPDWLKVASRDLTNLPLLAALAETEIPIILSTGMSGERELDQALDVITRHHHSIVILHCLAQYPAQYENMNLLTIPYLKQKYPNYEVGYSDHSVGITCPVAAVALGATVIEKHITLSHGMKGADHRGSLAPDGMYRMVRDIRNVERALGKREMTAHASSQEAQRKLERSLATRRAMRSGEVVTEHDLHLLSPGVGLRWVERGSIVGKQLAVDIQKDELILHHHVR